MKKSELVWKVALGTLLWIVIIFTVGSVAFWLTLMLFRHVDKAKAWLEQFSPVMQQYVFMIGTILTAVLLILIGVRLATWIFGRNRTHPIISLIGTIRQLSQGDFDIQVLTERNLPREFGELAESIYDMAAELKELERMRQEFISNVSHEIQSPLTSISGYSRALRSHPNMDAAERMRVLEIIETESMRLSRLSDNLLKLTSLESCHYPHEIEEYRLDRQLRGLILACEPQWSDKLLEMDVRLDEIMVSGDEDALSQVWVNLLHNAIKFTPERGTITVELTRRDHEIAVIIADTGIGITEEDQPHLFERFYKADKARVRSGGGSGLGLSIAHKIVELHGGTITVKSTFGCGSEFTVLLPVKA